MTRIAFLALLLLCSCGPGGKFQRVHAPDCIEFSHTGVKDGRPITCQMLWCERYSGSLATLWCTEK